MQRGDKPTEEHPEVLMAQSLHKLKYNSERIAVALESIAVSLNKIANPAFKVDPVKIPPRSYPFLRETI